MLAAQQPHTRPVLATTAHVLQLAVFETQAQTVAVLDEDLREVAAAREGASDRRLDEGEVESVEIHVRKRPRGRHGARLRERAAR